MWRKELVPIDVRGKVWRAPDMPEFGVSLDSYVSQGAQCGSPACRQWQEPLSGGTATITRDAFLSKEEGVNSSLYVHLPLIRRRNQVTLALVISARCASRAACDRALAVARTVRAVRRPKL